MANIGRRWVRSYCPHCLEVRNFTLQSNWTILCPHCGHERGLRLTPRKRREKVLATAG